MMTFSTVLARYGVGRGSSSRRRVSKGAGMTGFEKPPPAPTEGKGDEAENAERVMRSVMNVTNPRLQTSHFVTNYMSGTSHFVTVRLTFCWEYGIFSCAEEERSSYGA